MEDGGTTTLMHLGETFGFSSALLLEPNVGVGVVLLGNGAFQDARLGTAALKVYKSLLRYYQVDDIPEGEEALVQEEL